MTAEEKYAYWLELARYDLESADAMFASERWFYVAFMCQQAIEKLCKGLYTLYLDDYVPKIHNITTVFSRFRDKLSVTASEDTLRFFDTLSTLYSTNRYPDFTKYADRQISKTEAEQLISKTREVFSWLLTLKP